MIQSPIVAQFVSKLQHHLASAFPDSVPICHLTSAASCAPAQHADQSQRRDGLAQLQIQREILLAQASHARSLRQSKAASRFEAELREITLEILWQGQH